MIIYIKHLNGISQKTILLFFKESRNRTQNLICRPKKDHFKAKIENDSKDSKLLLQSLRDLGMPSKKIKTSSSTLGLKLPTEFVLIKQPVQKKLMNFTVFSSGSFCQIYRVTDGALTAETMVWPNFFLMNVFFALKGSKLFIIIYTTVASKLVEKLPKSLNKFGKKFVDNFYLSKGVKPNSYFFQQSLKVKFEISKRFEC